MKDQITLLIVALISVSTVSANPCAGLYWGQSVQHSEFCHKYYTCVLATAYEQTCRANHIFNPRSSSCEPGDQETCELYSETTTAPPTTEPTTTPHPPTETTTTPAPPTNPCSGLLWGQLVPHPTVCYKYYTCVLGTGYERTCSANNIFNPRSSSCEPGNQDTCELYSETTIAPPTTESPVTEPATTEPATTEPATTEPATTTTEATTLRPPVNLDEICHGIFFAARPYPDSQTIYVGCMRGSGILFQCLENEYFSHVTNECELWGSETTVHITTPDTTTHIIVPETTTTIIVPETTTRLIPTTIPPPSLEGICYGIQLDYIEHPASCALYIFCYEGYYLEKQCPEHQIFDHSIRGCRYGDHITCEFIGGNTAPVTEPTQGTTTTGETTTVATTIGVEETTVIETTVPTVPNTSSTAETTTTEEITTTTEEITTTTEAVYNPCEGVQTGNVADENNCWLFYRCLMQRPVHSQCPENQIFHPERLICVAGDRNTCILA